MYLLHPRSRVDTTPPMQASAEPGTTFLKSPDRTEEVPSLEFVPRRSPSHPKLRVGFQEPSRQRPAQGFLDHLGRSADRPTPDSEARIASLSPFSQHPQNPVDDDRRLLVQVGTAATLGSHSVIVVRRSTACCNSVKVVRGNGACVNAGTRTPRRNVPDRPACGLVGRSRVARVVIAPVVADVVSMAWVTDAVCVVCGSA